MTFQYGRGFGPADGFMKAYLQSVDKMTRSSQPALKSMFRAQVEAGGFVTKRMKANMEFPSRLSQCQTPADAIAATTQYWMDFFEDCVEASNRTMQLSGWDAFGKIAAIDDWVPTYAPDTIMPQTARERDVIDLRTPDTPSDRPGFREHVPAAA